MSIDHLKKQAKNLHKLLPEFVQKHGLGTLKLSDCQELIAQINGYGSWHSAVNQGTRPRFAQVVLTDFYEVYFEKSSSQDVTASGNVRRGSNTFAMLYPRDYDQLELATDELDEILDAPDWPDSPDTKPSAQACRSRVARCEKLIAKYPGLIDGYAHWAIGMSHQGQHRETAECLQPIFDQLITMFSGSSDVRLPYSSLENRPIHRLAHSLVFANYKLATVEGAAKAKSVATTMLKLWPNDNIGFRYLLDGLDTPDLA
ncbi:MAG: hypothetical protein IPJ18_18320 [Betaproteobacteria bacterium]|nr:hypothetical protein [Betaproteobacteria bacterium]